MIDYAKIDTSEKYNWSGVREGLMFVSFVLLAVFVALLLSVGA